MAHFISKRGLQWHYASQGKGDVILFIHGFGGSGLWWHNQQEFLNRDFHVVTVDLPGHGHSAWMPVSLNDMAQDIGQLMHSFGDINFSIVASSFGGLIAHELYRHKPERVMRISFVGSIPKFARSDNYPAGLDIERIHTLSRQFEGDYGTVLDMFFRSLFTMKERQSERFKQLKDLRAHEKLPHKEALLTFLKILEVADVRDMTSRVICPLQYITGQEDYICPRPIMDWVEEHSYNARFDYIKDCGHLPFLTEAEEYNRLLEDFLLS